MPMPISDANDVQTLIRWAYALPNAVGHVPDDLTAHQAAQRLADRSSKVLGAGLRADALEVDGRMLQRALVEPAGGQ